MLICLTNRVLDHQLLVVKGNILFGTFLDANCRKNHQPLMLISRQLPDKKGPLDHQLLLVKGNIFF